TDDAGMEVEQVGIIFCLVRGVLPKRMRTTMEDLRSERGDAVFSAQLGERTHVAESVEKHKPILDYKPNSVSAQEVSRIAEDFPGFLRLIDAYVELAQRSALAVNYSRVANPPPRGRNGEADEQHLFDLLRSKKLFATNQQLADLAARVLPGMSRKRFDKMS